MNKILLIMYYFPPLGGAGTQRSSKFVKYLARAGWSPTVIGGLDPSWPQDRTLLTDIPQDVRVHRIPLPISAWRRWRNWMFTHHLGPLGLGHIANQIGRVFDFPDTQCEWADTAALLALALTRQEKYAAIYISMPPYSVATAFVQVQSQLGLPLIVDFRDPWANNEVMFGALPEWLRRRHSRAERNVVFGAEEVVCAHPRLTAHLMGEYQVPAARMHTVFNGFDDDDYRDFPPYRTSPQKQVTIAHVGSFYKTYTPAALAKALREYWPGPPAGVPQVELCFIGGTGDVTFEGQPGLKVTVTPRVTHDLALRAQRDANLLLMTFDRNLYAGHIPGKVFEYLGSGRPIVGVLPTENATAGIIRDCRAGWVVDCDQPQAIIQTLHHAIQEVSRPDFRFEPDRVNISQYSRSAQTKVLAGIFDLAVAQKATP